MSNLSKALVVIAISFVSTNVLADWQADAAHLSSETGVDTMTAINDLKNELDKFRPPQPCVDKDPQTFTLGTPATLACAGGSGSGGSVPGGGMPGGGAGSTVDEQGKGTGKTFDIMN